MVIIINYNGITETVILIFLHTNNTFRWWYSVCSWCNETIRTYLTQYLYIFLPIITPWTLIAAFCLDSILCTIFTILCKGRRIWAVTLGVCSYFIWIYKPYYIIIISCTSGIIMLHNPTRYIYIENIWPKPIYIENIWPQTSHGRLESRSLLYCTLNILCQHNQSELVQVVQTHTWYWSIH